MLMSWEKTQLVYSLVLKSAVISVRLDSFLCEESFGEQAAFRRGRGRCRSRHRAWFLSAVHLLQSLARGAHTVSKVNSFSDNSVTGVIYQQGN